MTIREGGESGILLHAHVNLVLNFKSDVRIYNDLNFTLASLRATFKSKRDIS
jgi:hypothetical protein